MNTLKRLPPSFLVVVLLFSSCSDPASNSNEQLLENLIEADWQLNHITEAELAVAIPPNDSLFTIHFTEESGLEIKDNCNLCNGSYTTNDHSISFGNLSCTLALCAYTKLNTSLSAELENIKSFRIVDGELQLSSDDTWVKRVLHFRNEEGTDTRKVLLTDNERFDRDSWDDGSYQVELIGIKNDIVTLKVSYSGCGVKDINMVFYNYFLESEPVQAYAILPQINEACRAVFSEEYSFDLSPLKEKHKEIYFGNSGSISISIRENGDTLEQFLYEF